MWEACQNSQGWETGIANPGSVIFAVPAFVPTTHRAKPSWCQLKSKQLFNSSLCIVCGTVRLLLFSLWKLWGIHDHRKALLAQVEGACLQCKIPFNHWIWDGLDFCSPGLGGFNVQKDYRWNKHVECWSYEVVWQKSKCPAPRLRHGEQWRADTTTEWPSVLGSKLFWKHFLRKETYSNQFNSIHVHSSTL